MSKRTMSKKTLTGILFFLFILVAIVPTLATAEPFTLDSFTLQGMTLATNKTIAVERGTLLTTTFQYSTECCHLDNKEKPNLEALIANQ